MMSEELEAAAEQAGGEEGHRGQTRPFGEEPHSLVKFPGYVAHPDRVVLRNARQHNLKGITVELPRRALTVITGPSGSGKSSLAFDTLYAEGQRRYIESLSTYAKQFLERMPKPLVDRLEGLSPAVAIEQKNPTTSSRSTVGTATEIYDYPAPALGPRRHAVLPRPAARSVQGRHGPGGGGRHHRGSGSGSMRTPVPSRFPLPDSRASPGRVTSRHSLAAAGLRARPGRWRRSSGSTTAGRPDLDAGRDARRPGDRRPAAAPTGHEPRPSRRRRRDRVQRGRGRGGGARPTATGAASPSIPPAQPAARRRRALTPAPVLVQQSARRLPGMQRLRRRARVRRVADRPRPRALARATARIDPWTKPRYEGRRRLLRETAARHGISVDAPWRDLPAAQRRSSCCTANDRAATSAMFPFLERARREALQAVHPGLSAAVPARQDLPRLPRRPAQAGGARGAGRRPDHRRGRGASPPTELRDWTRRPSRCRRFNRRSPARSCASCTARVSFVARRRPRLPHARSADPDPVGRRGPAHRALQRAGLASVDTLYVLDEPIHRPAPARHRPPARPAAPARATPATPWSWSSTIPPPCAPRTTWSSWGPGAARHGGHVVYQGPGRRRARGRHAHRRST